MPTQILPSNTFTTAKWIVSATASDGTHTTIGAALTSASSGDTIFIRPGTYTENLTLKAGVDLVSYPGQGLTPNVIINGNCTFSGAGTVTISGISLQTNSAACVTVSGSAASILNLESCEINCLNNTGITYSSSNAASFIYLYNCTGNIATTGISFFSHSSAGTIFGWFTEITNTGASTTASTVSGNNASFRYCYFNIPFSTSSSATISFILSTVDCTAINTTAVTTGGGVGNQLFLSEFSGGSATALTINAQTFVNSCSISSTNTNAISGSSTITYGGLTYNGSTSLNVVTTQSGGTLRGSQNTAPSAGFLGEQIRSATTGVSLSSTFGANVVNISITAGVWDVSAVGIINDSSLALTFGKIGISTNTGSFTGCVSGDSLNQISSNAIFYRS
jgi:hypothetical protein